MKTKRQVAALKYLILSSKDGSKAAKRIAIYLIEQSQQLTKEVCISLVTGEHGYTARQIQSAAENFDSFISSLGSTHLNEVCVLMGGEFCFSFSYGDYDNGRNGDRFDNDGQFAGSPVEKVRTPGLARMGMTTRYTFWFAKKRCSRQSTRVPATKELLSKMDIVDSGLYP